ncbi:MarR family winged helix-turn-helix transcriptional regulator [Chloroflexota bacterium]
MSTLSIDDKNYKTWALLHEASHISYNIRKKELSNIGILARWVPVVQSIKRLGDSATPSEIGRVIFRSRNATSLLLNRMEKEGLIVKSRNSTRKNSIKVSLTEKGMWVYNMTTSTSTIIDRAFKYLSRDQRLQLESALQNILKGSCEEMGFEWESSSLHGLLYGEEMQRLLNR